MGEILQPLFGGVLYHKDPNAGLPATMIIRVPGAVLIIWRTGEHKPFFIPSNYDSIGVYDSEWLLFFIGVICDTNPQICH
jgi:hypothetical protein